MGRSKIVVVFDIDGTLTPIRSAWSYVHWVLNTRSRSASYRNLFFQGLISYDEWVVLDLQLWKGLSYSVFKSILCSIPWRKGTELLRDLRRKYRGDVVFVAITGGFNEMCRRVIEELEFDACKGTEIDVRNGKLTGLALDYVPLDGKVDALKELLEELNVEPRAIVSIGDSVNDVPLFEVSNISIAFCCDEDVASKATLSIRTCSMRELVKVLTKILESIV